MYCDHCGRRNHFKKDCHFFKKMNKNYSGSSTNHHANTIQAEQTNNKDSFAFMFSQCKLSYSNHNQKEIVFLLDSGATDHIVNMRDVFSEYTELPSPLKINVAKDGVSIQAYGRGKINVTTNLGIQGTIEEVLYSPEVLYNLLSVNRIQQAGMVIVFDNVGVHIYKENKCIMSGTIYNNLYKMSFKINLQKALNLRNDCNLYDLWHKRLGHLNKQKFMNLKKLVDDHSIIDKIVVPTAELCEPCIIGKQSRLPFAKLKKKKKKLNNNRPLFIVHTDVCGPITPPTIDDKNYFVNFIDD